MAKMFYTLEEAAEKLGKDADAVRDMAKSGQIQEFRDRDKLMFKVDQIDLLAHGDDDISADPADMSSMIPLADDDAGDSFDDFSLESALDLDSPSSSAAPGASASDEFSLAESAAPEASPPAVPEASDAPSMSASQSASALDLEPMEADPKEQTGVSIFDADELDTADPSAVTQMSDGGFDELQLDSVGSGSGLLDLTRESDDTSLGAEFLDELYPADDQTVDQDAPSGGLFETSGEEANAMGVGQPMPAGAMVAAEPLDGAGSGLAAGLSIGMVAALAVGIVAVIIGLMDAPADNLMALLADNFIIIVGALAGAALIFGVLGLVIGKKSG